MPISKWPEDFLTTFRKLQELIEKEMGPITLDGNWITFKNDGAVYQVVLYKS